MTAFWRAEAVDLTTLAVFFVGAVGFFAAVVITRLGTAGPGSADKRSGRSIVGVVVQGVGMALAGGPPRVASGAFWPPAAPLQTLAVALLMGGCVALFVWSARTMGDNWGIVARTRSDHQLVTSGPFAWVRNPIYVALALFMFGMAVATGRVPALLIALPVFVIGTLIRTSEEERMLRAHFGVAYDAYAARVKRFVPGVI